MSRSRGWVFTINNPTEWDEVDLANLKNEADYLIYGKETGECGTPHYQGFVRFLNARSFASVKSLLPRAHVELQRGAAWQAADYCRKEGDFQEFGNVPSKPSGSKTKLMWKQCIEWAESGELDKIKEEYPHIYLLHMPKLLAIRRRQLGILPGSLSNEWWVGPTGSGKSRRLWELYPDHYSKGLNKWWCGYGDEPVVAIEEMDPDHGKYLGHFLKIWADRYPFSPEIKGAHIKKIRPEKIIVLSNYTIDECFERAQDRLPIKRRFKTVHFHNLFDLIDFTEDE